MISISRMVGKHLLISLYLRGVPFEPFPLLVLFSLELNNEDIVHPKVGGGVLSTVGGHEADL